MALNSEYFQDGISLPDIVHCNIPPSISYPMDVFGYSPSRILERIVELPPDEFLNYREKRKAHPIEGLALLAIVQGDEIVLFERRKSRPLGNGFLGEKPEDKDTTLDVTAVRGGFDEAGIRATDMQDFGLLAVVDRVYFSKEEKENLFVVYFYCRVRSEVPIALTQEGEKELEGIKRLSLLIPWTEDTLAQEDVVEHDREMIFRLQQLLQLARK